MALRVDRRELHGNAMVFIVQSGGAEMRMTFTPLSGGRVDPRIERSTEQGKTWAPGFDGIDVPRAVPAR